jgi:hypothetical protein
MSCSGSGLLVVRGSLVAGLCLAIVGCGDGQAPPGPPPAPTTITETRIDDTRALAHAVWHQDRWALALHFGLFGPNAVSMQTFGLDGQPRDERRELVRDVLNTDVVLATSGGQVAVAWLTQLNGGYRVWLWSSDRPQAREVGTGTPPLVVNHPPHLGLAWNGDDLAILHGNQVKSEVVLLDATGQVRQRLTSAASRYPGFNGRLLVKADTGFAFAESCTTPTERCLLVRWIQRDGSERNRFQVSVDPDSGIPVALAADPGGQRVRAVRGGLEVLEVTSDGQRRVLAPALDGAAVTERWYKTVDAVSVAGSDGQPRLHVAWTRGSQLFHLAPDGTLASGEQRDLFSDRLAMAAAPGAIGMFVSRSETCGACDPPPTGVWYATAAP